MDPTTSTGAVNPTPGTPAATPSIQVNTFVADLRLLLVPKGIEATTIDKVAEYLLGQKVKSWDGLKRVLALAISRDKFVTGTGIVDGEMADLEALVEEKTAKAPQAPTGAASQPAGTLPTTATAVQAMALLAPLPDQESMLKGLILVDVSKISRDDLSAAIRGALAYRAGLFNVPDVVLAMMDDFVTNRMQEPAPKEYYDLEDLLAERDNADVLKVLRVSGRHVSKERKRALMDRMAGIWRPVYNFHETLRTWQESYIASSGNPAALMSAMSMMLTGGGAAGIMAQTLSTMPDTTSLHDGAQVLIQQVNQTFAGRVLPAVWAVAYDAERINKVVLDNPAIIRYTGCVNREDLARALASKIGSALVTPEYKRLEQTLTQYILSVIELDERAPVGSPNEVAYLAALFQLGNSIPWGKVLNGTGIDVIDAGPGRPNRPTGGGQNNGYVESRDPRASVGGHQPYGGKKFKD